MNSTNAPQIHPAQRLTAPDGTLADIDSEIVPLVRALWALGLATTVQPAPSAAARDCSILARACAKSRLPAIALSTSVTRTGSWNPFHQSASELRVSTARARPRAAQGL